MFQGRLLIQPIIDMSSILKEILDMVALPYKWIDDKRAIFSYQDKKYGIYIDFLDLKLKKIYEVCNISFGLLRSDIEKFSENDLDTSITNFGKPRTILSTVAEACIVNQSIIKSDIICLAASDQSKSKRLNIYSLATSEIISKVPAFNRSNTFLIKTQTGSEVIIISKFKFDIEDQLEISSSLGIDKL